MKETEKTKEGVQLPISPAPAAGTLFLLPITILGILSTLIIPGIGQVYQGNNELVFSGLKIGLLGAAFLLVARIPLYLKGRFKVWGNSQLPRFFEIIYRIAYVFIFIALGIYGIVIMALILKVII